jgi:putative ABC transport system permease protein
MLTDLAHALRQWLRTPVVAALAVASLALGIGANAALFGVVDALLLKSLPVRDPHSLIRVEQTDPHVGPFSLTLSSRAWEYVRDRQPFAEAVLATANGQVNLTRGGEVRYVPAVYISGAGMSALGIEPVIGRAIQPADDVESAEAVAMISYGLWRRDFQGSTAALGQTIWLTNHPFTIVGVVPRSFYGFEAGQQADVFVPLSGDAPIRRAGGNEARRPDAAWLDLYGRLRPGQSIADATLALRSWVPELRDATRPAGPDGERYFVNPVAAISGAKGVSFLRQQYRQPLLVLLGAVALVLVIACANLAALVLARFSDRRHELGLRLALGASRARIVRMLVAESLLLATTGGTAGLILAQLFVAAMVPYLSPAGRPQSDLNVSVDLRLLAYTALAALVSGAIAGLLPAWRASKVAPQVSLAASSRGGMHGTRATRALRVMVAGQVALSLVLVAGASVMVRSFIGLATAATGVDEDRILIAQVSGTLAGADADRRYERIEEIRRALSQLPGVAAVSGGTVTPLSSSIAAAQVIVPGSIYKAGSNEVRMNGASFTPFNNVLPNYFATIGTPVLMGRDFDDRDGPGSPPVAVVNQAFATRHFGDANPIGRTVIVNGQTLEIVGMVANAKQMSLKDERPMALGYAAFMQMKGTRPIPTLRFALRTDQPEAVRTAVAGVIRGVDPQLSIDFRNMRDEAEATINRERLMAWMAGIFALLGLAMAAIGLYGTFTYAVTRRRPEIGVRMAVGAGYGDILRMILGEAAVVLAVGTLVGLAGALAAGRVLQSLLVSVSARDPWMLTAAVGAVAVAAAAASLIPARRASLTDPMVALREE